MYIDTIEPGEREMLFDVVEESHRAAATKTLVRPLDAEIDAETDRDG